MTCLDNTTHTLLDSCVLGVDVQTLEYVQDRDDLTDVALAVGDAACIRCAFGGACADAYVRAVGPKAGAGPTARLALLAPEARSRVEGGAPTLVLWSPQLVTPLQPYSAWQCRYGRCFFKPLQCWGRPHGRASSQRRMRAQRWLYLLVWRSILRV